LTPVHHCFPTRRSSDLVRAEEGVRVAEAVDHPYSRISAYVGVGYLYLRQGHLSQAIPVLERGLGLSQAAHIPFWFPRVASLLGADRKSTRLNSSHQIIS